MFWYLASKNVFEWHLTKIVVKIDAKICDDKNPGGLTW